MSNEHSVAGGAIDWDEAREARLAAMSSAERDEYEAAAAEAELCLDLAQMVYDARTAAGLSQTELARRMGTSQAAISQIEGGGQVPTITTLARVARATGRDLRITLPAA